MFETAEIGRKVSKEEFDALAPALRIELVDLQQRLRKADFPVLIVFAGVEGAGKSETLNLINEWMDPRWIETNAYGAPSEEEWERPEYWRYWRDLPPQGKIGIFLSSWYSQPVMDHVYGRINDAELDQRLERIFNFSKCLADDGALVLKFWMHLSAKAQKRRLKALEKDENESWRVTETDWEHYRLYDKFVFAAERCISRTSTDYAPWQIVEGEDSRYRSLTVLTSIRDAAEAHLRRRALRRSLLTEMEEEGAAGAALTDAQAVVIDGGSSRAPLPPLEEMSKDQTDGSDSQPAETRTENPASPAPSEPTEPSEAAPKTGSSLVLSAAERSTPVIPPPQPSILQTLEMNKRLDKVEYGEKLQKYRARLNYLYREAKKRGVSTVLVFEGWDAAGKGGAIRRLTAAMDARDYRVIPIAAPNDEERVRHYLWRFWRHLSRAGRVTLFDRSWYGRVLVERVEGFATRAEWMRAYGEINDFERQLVEHGIVLVKYWLHITPEEQHRRFMDRQAIPYKRWKLTEEDWRNREKWEQYEAAVNNMIERTSTYYAPWTLVEANNKRYARVKVIRTLCKQLEAALGIEE